MLGIEASGISVSEPNNSSVLPNEIDCLPGSLLPSWSYRETSHAELGLLPLSHLQAVTVARRSRPVQPQRCTEDGAPMSN